MIPPKPTSTNPERPKDEIEVDIPEKKHGKKPKKTKKKETVEKKKAEEDESDDIKIPSWLKDRFNK